MPKGVGISLTGERRAHLQEHPEMREQEDRIALTLLEPDVVVQSPADKTVRLFHRLYRRLDMGHKYLCVVVKYTRGDAFVLTAYFTDKIKRGKVLGRRSHGTENKGL